jgi:Raf kinase inhibitor-like YbhB/YbcL family protein
VIVLVAGAGTGCDTSDGREMSPPTLEQRLLLPTTTTTTTTPVANPADPPSATSTSAPSAAFTLTVLSAPDGVIDERSTCEGNDSSPALVWTTPPPGTVEMALLVRDQAADGFVHWAVAGIEPTAGHQPEAADFAGGVEGLNDRGEVGWIGPCPQPGDQPHTYRFQLIALSERAELPARFSAGDLLAVPQRAPIFVAEAVATFPA